MELWLEDRLEVARLDLAFALERHAPAPPVDRFDHWPGVAAGPPAPELLEVLDVDRAHELAELERWLDERSRPTGPPSFNRR